MRDGAQVGLGQRVGVGMWLAIGAVLALLAFQTSLVSGDVVVTELGAGAAPATEVAASPSPQLPVATPNVLQCTGSDCPVPVPVVPVPVVPPSGPTAADLANVPADLTCVAGSYVEGVDGIMIQRVDPCGGEADAVIAVCEFVRADLGFGIESIQISTNGQLAVGDTVTTSTPAIDVAANNGTVYSQYDCAGSIKTIEQDFIYD